MEKILSIYFQAEKVYVLLVENNNDIINIKHVNSTEHAVNFKNLMAGNADDGAEELKTIISDQNFACNKAAFTFPSEKSVIRLIPGSDKITDQEIHSLVDFEIKNSFSNFGSRDFSTNIYRLGPENEDTFPLLAVMINNTYIEIAKQIISKDDVNYISGSAIVNSLPAVMYNYPEALGIFSIVTGVYHNLLNLSLINNNRIFYNVKLPVKKINEIPALYQNEISRINNNLHIKAQKTFLYGNGLTKKLLERLTAISVNNDIETVLVNTFRKTAAEISDEEKNYCYRTAHILPPVLGACLYKMIDKTTLNSV